MKKNIKFLVIGAVMTGMFSLAHADNNINNNKSNNVNNVNINKEDIKAGIKSLIQKQIDNQLFSEKSDITFNFVEPTKIQNSGKIKNNMKKGQVVKEEYDLSQNDTVRLGQLCKINLSFDKYGNIPYLGKDEQLMNLTKLQNENQKDIARKLVGVHEQSHCEFSNINNPVRLKNASAELNHAGNYFLKDMESLNLEGVNGGTELNYIGVLNESYADISAIMVLIKEYGANNPDLQYVLKVFEVQRHDFYIQQGANVHNTHVGINSILTKDNIEKIELIKTQKDFQDFALMVANDSVQKLLTQRKDFFDNALNSDNFGMSVMLNMIRIMKQQGLSEEEKNQYQASMWKEGVKPGLTFNLAKEFVKDVDVSKYNLDMDKKVKGKRNVDPVEFAMSILSADPAKIKIVMLTYDKFKEKMDDFKTQMYKNNENLVDMDTMHTKADIMKKVSTLRTQFVEDTQAKKDNKEIGMPKSNM